jgi:Helix-turn-helix domain
MRSAIVQHSSQPERFVGPIEAAAFLDVHPKTLQRFSRCSLVPAHPFGEGKRKRWRYLLSELELWLRSRSASGPNSSVGSTFAAEAVDFSKQLR